MNELNRSGYSIYGDSDPYLAIRPLVSREVITGDYFIPSSILRKIVNDMLSVATKEDTSEALESLLKLATSYELYLRKN